MRGSWYVGGNGFQHLQKNKLSGNVMLLCTNIKKSSLYIEKATARFFQDADSTVHSLMLDFLKPGVDTGTYLQSYSGDTKDISPVKAEDIIYGPVDVIPLKGNKWSVPIYDVINDRFERVKNLDRHNIFMIEL